jgi:hypothetical protein
MNEEMIKMLIAVSDADGVYTMMRDMGEDEMADWIQEKKLSLYLSYENSYF